MAHRNPSSIAMNASASAIAALLDEGSAARSLDRVEATFASRSAHITDAIAGFPIHGAALPGFAFLASIVAIFSGAQLFALGIIGAALG